MMLFLNPLDALIPKIPIFIFCRILGLGHLRGPGVSLGRNLGVPSIEPFFGGGSGRRALSTPTPPQTKTRPPQEVLFPSFSVPLLLFSQGVGTHQHSPNTPTTGLRGRGNGTGRSTGRSGRQNAATQRNMRREERVTVQGPVKEQQPDGMSRGGEHSHIPEHVFPRVWGRTMQPIPLQSPNAYACTPKYQRAHLLSVHGNPSPGLCLIFFPQGGAPPPPFGPPPPRPKWGKTNVLPKTYVLHSGSGQFYISSWVELYMD